MNNRYAVNAGRFAVIDEVLDFGKEMRLRPGAVAQDAFADAREIFCYELPDINIRTKGRLRKRDVAIETAEDFDQLGRAIALLPYHEYLGEIDGLDVISNTLEPHIIVTTIRENQNAAIIGQFKPDKAGVWQFSVHRTTRNMWLVYAPNGKAIVRGCTKPHRVILRGYNKIGRKKEYFRDQSLCGIWKRGTDMWVFPGTVPEPVTSIINNQQVVLRKYHLLTALLKGQEIYCENPDLDVVTESFRRQQFSLVFNWQDMPQPITESTPAIDDFDLTDLPGELV